MSEQLGSKNLTQIKMGAQDKQYNVTTDLKNVKSHYGEDGVKFEANKPITVIAGPNGEGKSNLIEGILFGIGNFIERSPKLNKESSFFKEVKVSDNPRIRTTFKEIVLSDLIKKGLHPKKSEIGLPERFLPNEMVSYGKTVATISTSIHGISDKSTSLISKSNVSISRYDYEANIDKNGLEHFDLIYLNTDSDLSDFFVKYVGQIYTEEINKIQGKKGQNEYFQKILNYFPNEKDRLIQDVDSGRFEEKYYRGKFISSSLPTGAKKECLLYVLGILREMHQTKKDWLSVIVVDEIESGLHMNRKKRIIDALIAAFHNDPILRNHVKFIFSTHSPVIYSELQKHDDVVDIYFVLRERNKPSIIYKQGELVEDQELVEKRILSELGLNVYELPNKILFVEGPTDKLFFQEIFDDAFIQPFYTCNINQMVRDFIIAFPIVRSKEYKILVDKNGMRQIEIHVDEIEQDTNLNLSFKASHIGANSLEEFIFDIDVSGGGNVSTIWNKIESKIEQWNQLLDEDYQININFTELRGNLEPKGRDGLRVFLEKNIKKNQKMRYIYSVIGANYKQMLSVENVELLKKFSKEARLKMKQ